MQKKLAVCIKIAVKLVDYASALVAFNILGKIVAFYLIIS